MATRDQLKYHGNSIYDEGVPESDYTMITVALWLIVALLVVIAVLLKKVIDQQTIQYIRQDQLVGQLYKMLNLQTEKIEKAVYAVHGLLLTRER